MFRRNVSPVVTLVLLSLGLAPSARAEKPSGRELEQRLDALVRDFYPDANAPGAAVLVVIDGKPVLRKGYGLADLEKRTPITPETIFRIGSITKQFTAVAVLQLVQAGKVALDDPISKWVPDFDTQGKAVTIEHLLSHTSGIPSYTAGPEYIAGMARDVTPAEILGMVADRPMEFEPGERFKYSNTNYVLLGMVIEKASGQSYAEYLQEHIARPLGLKDTRYGGSDSATDRHARGYNPSPAEGWAPAQPLSMTQPYAAGAIESTVDDLARWTVALAEGKAVDPALLERAWTPFNTTSQPSRYGFGWTIRVDDANNERWIGHGGGINGFKTDAVWIPEKTVYVAVLRNTPGDPPPEGLVRQLAQEAAGRPVKRRVAITLPVETLERYVGVYAIAPDFKLTVTREGEKLFIQGTGQRPAEVYPESENTFFARVVDAQFRFTVENGKATGVTLFQNGREMPGARED